MFHRQKQFQTAMLTRQKLMMFYSNCMTNFNQVSEKYSNRDDDEHNKFIIVIDQIQ